MKSVHKIDKHGALMTLPILETAGGLLARYPVVFCDIWGVLHNGIAAFPAAGAVLAAHRRAGGTVVLVSNAPRAADAVARILDEKGVRQDCWDAIVSSGDLTRDHISVQGFARIHHIGPRRDDDLFDAVRARRVGFEEAEALIVTGLNDDRAETGESYRPLLEKAVARRLPLVCANPDLVVHVGDLALPCAGAVAVVHERLGGEVYWAGKPHRPAYARAHAIAAELRGGEVARGDILAVGDALATDLAGAARYGIASAFIAEGIHRDDVMTGGRIDPARLARLLAGAEGPPPVATLRALA